LSKDLNEVSRKLLKALMGNLISEIQQIVHLVNSMLVKYRHKEGQTKKQKSTQAEQFAVDEMQINSRLRKILHGLNDVRVLLSNDYTRQYLLESLNQEQKSLSVEEQKSGIDTIKLFLKSVVTILLRCQGTLGMSRSSNISAKLSFTIIHAAKLILFKFLGERSICRQSETQRLLQEMLLDLVVDELEKHCGLHSKSKRQAELNKQTRQD